MLRQNIAGSLSQIGLNAVQPATVIDRNKGNLAEDLAKAYSGWDSANKKQAYIDALQGGDQEKIDSALASYNPEAYAQVMQAREQRANQLADADTQFARQKELANLNFNNDMALKRLEAALKPATTAQQNMEYLIKQGYTPEEAAQLYYSGQNPNLNVMALGQKGQEAYGKEAGKNIAEREKAALEAQDEYNTVVSNIDRINELLPNASVQTFIDRKTPTMFFSPEAQQARGELRNLLGGMRLDQMKYMKGAISDREQEFLSDVVSGDFSKYTPDEIKGTMNSILRKAGQIKNQFANMSAVPQKTDWANATNEDLLKGL